MDLKSLIGDKYRNPSSGSLLRRSTISKGSVRLSNGGEYRVRTELGSELKSRVLDRLRTAALSLRFEESLILDSSRGVVGGRTMIVSAGLGSRCSVSDFCFCSRSPGSSGRGKMVVTLIGSTEPLFCLLARGSGKGSLGP